jgi:cell fate regulator YaaT (PSP1 superfamily)
MERVKANNLVMKLTDAEWRWDRRKLTIYFTADKRVDFRNLVRELAAMFRTRIELKQIGVRDEAKRLGGIGRCGREYCSASWLPELRPVNLGVAKDQKLSLNPTQISGACGRLMCCLRYEHDFYVQQRKRFPKRERSSRRRRARRRSSRTTSSASG